MALGNGPLECELAAFNRELMALAGFTDSFAGFGTRQVHRERDYLSRASRWCERRERERLIGLVVWSASHSLSLGLKRQRIMALRQVAMSSAQAVPLIKHGGRCLRFVHGEE